MVEILMEVYSHFIKVNLYTSKKGHAKTTSKLIRPFKGFEKQHHIKFCYF